MKVPAISHIGNFRVSQIGVLLAVILCVGTTSPAQSARPGAGNAPQPRPVPSAAQEKVKQLYASLPLVFEKNQGQAAADAQYLAPGPGYLLSLSAKGADFSLRKDHKTVADLRMSLVGQNPAAVVTGVDEMAAKKNYLFGNDPSKWITRVPNFEKVSVASTLPGVDLLYYGNQQQLEYDFDLAPQADPQELVLQFDGAKKLSLDPQGDLIVDTAAGPVTLQKPNAWQPDSNSGHIPVSVAYTLRDRGRVAFQVAPYDHSRQLVIDPVIQYATYWGGIYNPNGSVKFYNLPGSEGPPIFGMATDSAGASYIYGLDIWEMMGSLATTTEGTCPSGGCANIFIMKFDPSLSGAASLVYTTLIPAMATEDFDNANPQNTELAGDGLYVRYNQEVDSTLYNNANNYPLQALALDGNGHLFFTGGTDNPNFPVTSNGYQTSCALNPADPLGQFCVPAMYISELSSDGTQILYSSLINAGPTAPPSSPGAPYYIYPAFGESIAVDNSGIAYVIGESYNGFPITNSYLCTDLYPFCVSNVALKVDTTKSGKSSLLFAEEFTAVTTPFVATDGAGNLYWAASGCIYADQVATNFGTTPITYNGFQSTTSPTDCSGTMVKLGPTGTPSYATYLPAYGEDESVDVYGLTVDADGRAYLGGEQDESTDPLPFPIANGFITPIATGEFGYVMALDTTQTGVGSLVYSSALDLGEHPVSTIAGNGCGSVAITGRTDSTLSSPYLVNQLAGSNNNPSQGPYGYAMVFNTRLSGLNSLTFSSFFPDDQTVPEAITLNRQGNLSIVGFAGYVIPPPDATPAQYGNLNPTPNAYQTAPYSYIPADDQVITRYNPFFEVIQQAITPGCINIAPMTLAFGSEPVGSTTAAQSVVLTNTSGVNLSISSIDASDGFTESDSCGPSLAPGAFCTVNAAFHPAVPGAQTGTLTFTNSDAGSPQVVALTGTGTGSAPPTATLTGISFGSEVDGTATAAMTATLTNTSTTTVLSISGITIAGANAADFTIATGTNACGTSLAANTSCLIYATFKATVVGAESATLSVADNATGSPQIAALSGTGTAPPPTATLTGIAFGNVTDGTTSAVMSATLTNTSASTALSISAITMTGANAADFTMTTGANACHTTLAANTSCSIYATFKPGIVGTESATLSVADNATGSPQSSSLSGTGTAATPTATLTGIAFGNVTDGSSSATMMATLKNTSATTALSINSYGISGANGGDFVATTGTTPCTGTLAANTSCFIYVVFKPTIAGAESATLSVNDNAIGSPQTAALTGIGTASSPTATVTAIAFGKVTENTTSAAMSATLTNTSTSVALTISSATITGTNGDDFSKSTGSGACGTTLAANTSCKIYATFTPSLVGAESAMLSVNDNATGSPQIAALTGTGAAPLVPVASLSPTALAFSNQQVNTSSASQTVTLSNNGTGLLTISSIDLTEPDEEEGVVRARARAATPTTITVQPSPSYSATTTCGATLAAGATCTVAVTFDPATTGSLPGTLDVYDNAAGSPQSATLTGAGYTGGNFTVASPTAPQTVKPGGSAQYTINVSVNPTGDIYNNAVTLTASGLPAGATAAFSPASVTPGTGTVSSAMTVQTSNTNALLAPLNSRSKWPIPSSLALMFGGAWALFRRKHRERFAGIVSLALLFGAMGVATIGLMGCGAGFAQYQPKTYTITVTGTSGEQTQTTTAQLTVE